MSERERFLRELEARLRLRGERRADALAEIASHIEAGVERGEEEDVVVKRLGHARDLATSFNRTVIRQRLIVAAALLFGVAAGAFGARAVATSTDPRAELDRQPGLHARVIRRPDLLGGRRPGRAW